LAEVEALPKAIPDLALQSEDNFGMTPLDEAVWGFEGR